MNMMESQAITLKTYKVYHQVPNVGEVQGVCLSKQDWIFIIPVQLQQQEKSQLHFGKLMRIESATEEFPKKNN
ncbi:hypothetical protein ACFX1Q_001103 [Malus domestica]